MSPKSPIPTRPGSGPSREIIGNIAFRQAVERAANLKCLQAIRAGKLRVVQRECSNPVMPLRFTPRMDIIDDPVSSAITAIFELPGVKTTDISLQIREGKLIIMGERRAPQAVLNVLEAHQRLPRNPVTAADTVAAGEMDVENHSPHTPPLQMPIAELRFGEFYRAIPVPEGMKESDVNASLQDGMLTVIWPKYPRGRTAQSVTPPATPSTTNAAQ